MKIFSIIFKTIHITLLLACFASGLTFANKLANTKHKHKSAQAAHVHGKAILTIALESPKSGTILLEAPGESLLGFEHKAKSLGEKKTQEGVFAVLDKRAADYFIFDKTLACEIVKKRIELKSKGSESDEKHTEIEAEYSLKCEKDLAGKTINIFLGKPFPKIKSLSIQVLGEKNQSSFELVNGKGSFKL